VPDHDATFWDNRYARHLGYRPKDSADAYRDAIVAAEPKPDRDDVVMRYQGGIFVK
jgi:uronate dehydrogenase